MANTSEGFYDRFSRFYPLVEIFLKPQKRKLFNEINRYPHGQLLEIGIGDGSNLKYYKAHEITGVDTSRNMLAEAGKKRKACVQLFHMDGQTLSFRDEAFDYVVLSHVIAVVENPEKLLEEVYRVLKPDGRVFVLNHFTPNNALKYVDKVFGLVSRLFHFRCEFMQSSLQRLQRFKLLQEFNAGLFSYFKILVYEKNR
ncbi:MAG TPA: class I SAM-dependent methyltransferase [Ohtaekwangia sp.]|nr:class I SAM-dependent methyltransferase [Ohtaekwangia sp.]